MLSVHVLKSWSHGWVVPSRIVTCSWYQNCLILTSTIGVMSCLFGLLYEVLNCLQTFLICARPYN